MKDYGTIQIGVPGPLVQVPIRNNGADEWQALYESRWRKVHIQVKRTFIVCYGEKYNIRIEGV